MQDLNGYDGSVMGSQWEYTIEQLPAEYQFLGMWEHFQLATTACSKFKEEEFLTINCKLRHPTDHVLFTPILIEMNLAMEGIHSKCNQFYCIHSFEDEFLGFQAAELQLMFSGIQHSPLTHPAI